MNINYNGALIGAEGNITCTAQSSAFAYGDAVTDGASTAISSCCFGKNTTCA